MGGHDGAAGADAAAAAGKAVTMAEGGRQRATKDSWQAKGRTATEAVGWLVLLGPRRRFAPPGFC